MTLELQLPLIGATDLVRCTVAQAPPLLTLPCPSSLRSPPASAFVTQALTVSPRLRRSAQDDWPGGVRQQFKAAGPMVQAFLRGMQPGEAVLQNVIDDADAIVEMSSGSVLKALVFPTADAFNEVRFAVVALLPSSPLLPLSFIR